jgi:type I restriction enzyme S subunit
MSDWKKYKLGEIATMNYGKSLIAEKRLNGYVPVYSSAGICGWHNESLENSNAIIVGRKGNVGSIFYSKTPFYCIDTAYYILPDKSYDLKFLYYKLLSLNLIKLTSDSAVPGLNRKTAYAQEITIPETIEEQIQIAQILTSFDDKIELLGQMNQTLETMAQTIFKEWFVDFNFPPPSLVERSRNDRNERTRNAELVEESQSRSLRLRSGNGENEEGAPLRSLSGAETSEVETLSVAERSRSAELVEGLPKGWRQGKLGEVCYVQNGYAFKSNDLKDFGDDGIIKIKNISDKQVDIIKTQFVSKTVSEKIDLKFKVKGGDVLIAMTGAEVGKIGLVPKNDNEL